jgi:hypothetical protein
MVSRSRYSVEILMSKRKIINNKAEPALGDSLGGE